MIVVESKEIEWVVIDGDALASWVGLASDIVADTDLAVVLHSDCWKYTMSK